MNQPLEPSYLRYVYDHLENGSITSDNASVLPQGFIGLYEQEFEANTPVNKRQEVLQQLATFALLKTAVSTRFVASILGVSEEVIEALIQNYSTWFNSPESGIYVLYHDRLRIYLLQKLSKSEVLRLNEQIIAVLEKSIETQNTDESEYYALQHLAGHMSLASQLGKEYKRLHHFVNQESLWQRQIKLSKGYEWSQYAVQQGIKEGARRNHEMNTIRSTVNSVKLMTQEQNSAEDILDLLSEGDYQTALKRAESWEGERQFKLYLLFIHELTIGTSKEADFRKEACKAVLEAIDQTLEDHSVLDWCKFYPELAIYKYHEELLKMELDGMVIWRRGEYTLKDISEWTDLNMEIINSLALEMEDLRKKNLAYREISTILMGNGEKEEALRLVSEIEDENAKSRAYVSISKILMENGEKEEAINMAFKIEDENAKWKAYASISTILMRNGEKEEALRLVSEIEDENAKSRAYVSISKILMENGEKEEAINVYSEILDEYYKSLYSIAIGEVLYNQCQNNEGKKELLNAIKIVENQTNLWKKAKIYALIIRAIRNQSEKEIANNINIKLKNTLSKIKDEEKKTNKMEYNVRPHFFMTIDLVVSICKLLIQIDLKNESLILAKSLTSKKHKAKAYVAITKILLSQGKINDIEKLLDEIDEINLKFIIYNLIIKYFVKKEQKEESINKIIAITDSRIKGKLFKTISRELMLNDNLKDFLIVETKSLSVNPLLINKIPFEFICVQISKIFISQGESLIGEKLLMASLSCSKKIINPKNKIKLYLKIIEVLLIQDSKKILDRLLSDYTNYVSCIDNQRLKDRAYVLLIKKIVDSGEYNMPLNLLSTIEDDIFDHELMSLYEYISKAMYKNGQITESINILSKIKWERYKCSVYSTICINLLENGEKNESLRVASKITCAKDKSIAYAGLSKILMEQGKMKESQEAIKDSLRVASEITNAGDKSIAYGELSKILMEQGKMKESQEAIKDSLKVASEITNAWNKSKAYRELSKILMEQGNIAEAEEAMNESLSMASEIIDSATKSRAYAMISKVLMEQGNMIEAIKIKQGSERFKAFNYFGKTLSFNEAQNLLSIIPSEDNQSAMIKGMSENIYEQMELSEAIYPYLYHHSKYTENLSNILFHQAKIACFFEKERNEEKLEMLSEVLDIKDWRRISA